MPDVVASVDDGGIIRYVSPAIERMLGYRPDEVIGRHFSEFTFPDDKERAEDAVKRGLGGFIGINENRLLTRSGEVRWVRFSNYPEVVDQRIIGVHSLLTDITQNRLLQDQLIRSERLAATGQLAASVAHEINSPLQGITSLLNMMRKKHRQDGELLGQLALLKSAFVRIRNTVKKLLDLNRPGKERRQRVNLNRLVNDTLDLVESLLKKNKIGLTRQLSAGLPAVVVSSQELAQVLMNLLNNAQEAVTGRKDPRQDGEIVVKTVLRKGRVVLEISDNGPGFSNLNLEQIFDPFYTKKNSMGMGIGLSICHDIIKEYGGTIRAENRDQGGALVRITLPAE